MELIKVKDYNELSEAASKIIINKVKSSNKVTIGFATGGTPLGTYKKLIEDYRRNHTSYQHVVSFNLDEYVGLSPSDPNSYHFYMQENLFQHIDISPTNIHIPNGESENLQKECEDYEKLIDSFHGIDLQILGIGRNGHIGFNEPGTSFRSLTHVVELAPSTRKANARFFRSLEEVPTHAVTMGIASILKSKEILLLAHGEEKAEAIVQLINGSVTEDFPASALKLHPNVTVIADAKALSKLTEYS